MQRLGILMEPEIGNPHEVEGVLNPAAVRGPDGNLYLFPRLVAAGNYSRIGIARVIHGANGEPARVERIGIALEPEADYERRPDGSGGCEDPRVTFVEPLDHYSMTYTALSSIGPRIAVAISKDLIQWKRLGLVAFAPYDGNAIGDVDDKDAGLFPTAVISPTGQVGMALLHRPIFPGTSPEETVCKPMQREIDLHRESIWISYRPMPMEGHDLNNLVQFTSHKRLATPVSPWERLKIGGGTPPVMTKHGWLIVYHGVSRSPNQNARPGNHLQYSAGVMVLSKDDPCKILYRSKHPVLSPVLPEERIGTIGDVVFPTGIDRRDDIGLPDRFDVYYGMADNRIGVARLDMPDVLPAGSGANPTDAMV